VGPIKAFHLGLAQVSEITLFLALGLLVFPSQFGGIMAEALLLAIVLALVARPVGVALATALDRYSARERTLLGWAGLRGAVPVVLALLPVVERVTESIAFLNLTFFAVLVSTLLQGRRWSRSPCASGSPATAEADRPRGGAPATLR